jgi:hypothetical protein
MNPNPIKPTPVQHRQLEGKPVAEGLTILDGVCSAGAGCQKAQGAPAARRAFDVLETAVAIAHTSLTRKVSLLMSLVAVIKALRIDLRVLVAALRVYETAIAVLAGGDLTVIFRAGLEPLAGKARRGTPAVRRTPVNRRPAPRIVSVIEEICDAGAACEAVRSSPAAGPALAQLQAALARASETLSDRIALGAGFKAALRALHLDYKVARAALRNYETVVGAVAGGDAALINEAGLLSSDDGPETRIEPGKVTGLKTRPGERATEALLSWRAIRGAAGYVIAVSLAAESPDGPWTLLGAGDRRPHRIVNGPIPRARFLARVAALRTDGTPAEWSDPILVTAC